MTAFPLFLSMSMNLNAYSKCGKVHNSINVDIATTTLSVTTTSTQAQIMTPTATLAVGTTQSDTLTPTSTGLSTQQNTQTSTQTLSGTLARTATLTATNTPNFTNTVGPTETFRPLPSITLLFPIDTATRTPEDLLDDDSDSAQNDISDVNNGQAGRISARSILLIGTIFILWVVLGIFLIFFLRRMGE